MAKAVFHTTILDTVTGLPVPNAEVGIIDASGGGYAPLWSDRAGTIPVSPNPTTADDNGFIEVYVTPGRFRIEADDGNGGTQTWEDELLGIVEEPYLSITSVTAADSTTVDFLTALSDPGIYQLTCQGGTVASDGASINMRVSLDGTTVESGASDYARYATHGNAATDSDNVIVTFAVGSDVGEEFSFCATVTVDSDGRLFWQGDAVFTDIAGAQDGASYASKYNGTGVTGIQFFASAGNISTGTFILRKIG